MRVQRDRVAGPGLLDDDPDEDGNADGDESCRRAGEGSWGDVARHARSDVTVSLHNCLQLVP